MKKLGISFAIAAAVYHMFYVGDVFSWIGFRLLPLQHRSISLATILVMCYVFFPARKGGRTHTVAGWITGLVGAALALYPVLNYASVTNSQLLGSSTTTEQLLVLALVLFILEASRRVLGAALPVVVAVFAVHPLVMANLPGMFNAPAQSLSRISNTYFFSSDGILGVILHVASTIIVMFVIFGLLLQHTGGAKFFLDLSLAMVGRVRGGPAKVAVVGSALMGSISGSSAANAATTGMLTIPLMKRSGYTPRFAAAVEAVASNGGQLLPPVMGVVAFLVAEFLGTSYASVVAAGLVPALIYYLVLLIQVDMRAARRNLKPSPDMEFPRVRQVFAEGWHNLVPIAVLVYSLMALRLSPERSAWWAILALLAVSSLRAKARIRLREIPSMGESFPAQFLPAGAATAAAGVILASLGLTGFGLRLSGSLVELSGGALVPLLLLAAVASFVLGMGMSSIPVYIILAVTVAPNLIDLGVAPMAAHLFVFWWGVTSFITPPVCITVYVTASLAGAHPVKAGLTAVKLGIANFLVPFVFVLEPELLLLEGFTLTFVVAAVSAVGGTVFIAAALEGYLWRVLNPLARGLYGIGGLLMLYPGWLTDLAGAGTAALAFTLVLTGVGRSRKPSDEADGVAFGQQEPEGRPTIVEGGPPLMTADPRTEETTTDPLLGKRSADDA